ncbi:IclR family transcriptional regulator [Kaistia sp. 32K]|uniref:IclR family transcriptional regulator n=1 Tax=Kaistia sp. 32K TaxID=2795690 RepID=UPI001915012F|nr:IclR family transcriptional regulator [Kaistia sp. 32K]BCP53505.1 IclR family transcriptional regulator [Kaistia sp. 32K]
MSESDDPEGGRKGAYTAPALEKGLEILELLADAGEPLSARNIADSLGRSKNEIFRMVFVLVERGYLNRDAATDRLTLSNKLFELGMRTPRSRKLVEVAMPAMERLSDDTGLSSHLVVVNRGETVVIAAAAGSAELNLTLRLGYRRPAIEASSGQTIMAFQTPEKRARLIAESLALSDEPHDPDALDAILDRIVADGSLVAQSHDLLAVVDVCAPILDRNGRAVASVVIPCLSRRGTPSLEESVRAALVEACREVSEALIER